MRSRRSSISSWHICTRTAMNRPGLYHPFSCQTRTKARGERTTPRAAMTRTRTRQLLVCSATAPLDLDSAEIDTVAARRGRPTACDKSTQACTGPSARARDVSSDWLPASRAASHLVWHGQSLLRRRRPPLHGPDPDLIATDGEDRMAVLQRETSRCLVCPLAHRIARGSAQRT